MSAAGIALRAGTIAAALALWFWTQRLLGRRTPPRAGVTDRVHDWTAPLNARLAASPRAADALLAVSSAGIDALGLWLLGAALLGPTFRPFLALFALYALRQLCQALCALPSPAGSIWRHPGFPSLFVTYGTDGDYFFSGHTAVAVLGAIAAAEAGPGWVALAVAALAAFEAATVLVLRAHYTMDVVAAACAAWCAWSFAGAVAPAADRVLALAR